LRDPPRVLRERLQFRFSLLAATLRIARALVDCYL
jgi:hypothetical protein